MTRSCRRRGRRLGAGLALLVMLLGLTTACGGAGDPNFAPLETRLMVATRPPTAASPTPRARPSATPEAPTAAPAPPSATPAPPTRAAMIPPPSATPVPAPSATPAPLRAIAVLAYHHFGVPDAGEFDCPLATFEEQLRWLRAHGYESIPPQQYVDYLHGQATLPAHPVILTFDDNNGEQYTDAAPLLEKYGYRGAFFIDTVTIGKRYFMSAPQLQDLARRGHLLGDHTWDHRDIAILTLHELRDQLTRSEDDLAGIMGHKPTFISYPFGAYSAAAVAELQARGYHGGFRLRDPGDAVAPEFRIHRQIIVGTWSLPEFAENIHWLEE